MQANKWGEGESLFSDVYVECSVGGKDGAMATGQLEKVLDQT
jgi:hypothetical protein